MDDNMARKYLNNHLYYLMADLFRHDYLDEDNKKLQIRKPPETQEAIQRLDVQRSAKTVEEIKMETRCLRMRKA